MTNRQFAFPRKAGKVGKPATPVDCQGAATDTQRLDWVIHHQSAQFDKDGEGVYVVAYLTSGDRFTDGVSGHFIGRGESYRECIDAFLRGQVMRID